MLTPEEYEIQKAKDELESIAIDIKLQSEGIERSEERVKIQTTNLKNSKGELLRMFRRREQLLDRLN